jgi:glycosyltransferase involved in cell wall biosynthesis
VVARWAWRDLAKVYGQADALTAPTPRAVQLLEQAGGLPGAVSVSCGLDLTRYRRAELQHDPPTVLFVGRLDEEKRVDELLRALATVPPTVSVRAEVIGDGSKRAELEELAQHLGIAGRVRFRGFVAEGELVDAYAAADVFCMPGVAELQSLATMEAMAAGLPVLAADAMALPHLVRPGRNGWLYPPGDIAVLAGRLTALLTDPALRRRMGAASRDAVAAHDIDRTLDAFESIYEQVVVAEPQVRAA